MSLAITPVSLIGFHPVSFLFFGELAEILALIQIMLGIYVVGAEHFWLY